MQSQQLLGKHFYPEEEICEGIEGEVAVTIDGNCGEQYAAFGLGLRLLGRIKE